MATMLYAIALPPTGGDTLFANQYLAYETLSDGLKATLRGWRAVSSAAQPTVAATRSATFSPDRSDTGQDGRLR